MTQSCRSLLLLPVVLFAIFVLRAQPASEPVLFAEVAVPPRNATGLTFSPDGNTVYFSTRRCVIMASQLRNGRWSEAAPVEFSGSYMDGDPFLSPDGSRLYFWSTRPLNGRHRGGAALWAADRTDRGWSSPRDLGVVINGLEGGTGFPSVAANGTLYFMANRAGSLGGLDIYRAKKVGEAFAEPENLGPAINSPADELDAYIAPDESFIVFASNRPVGFQRSDLYISLQKDGVCGPPRNLGPKINGSASQCCPAVSPDGKYFFYTGAGGGRSAIYRVGIAVLKGEATGEEPKPFAEGVISTMGAFGITFTPDGKTAYFAESGAQIVSSRLKDGKWSPPEPVAFSGRSTDLNPFVTQDGSRLFFSSNRQAAGQGPMSLSLWSVRREGAGWGAPRSLGPSINAGEAATCPNVAADGTLYFTAQRPDSHGGLDIYRARRAGAGYAPPENLGATVNSISEESGLFVSPDESYMVFTSNRPGGLGGTDFYISMRTNGAWTAPRNLGSPINTKGPECCASVSPDGRYFFFNRQGISKPGIYRVGVEALGLERK